MLHVNSMDNRFWQIDALRGVAMLLMVAFHFAFDLNYLNIVEISVYEMPWLLVQRITITLFLLLVGISLFLKSEKVKAQNKDSLKEVARRSLFLFVIAAGISVVTWLVEPQRFIAFGVIHFIALSTLLAIPFLRFEKLNLFVGAVLLAAGLVFSLPQINTPLLLWLGFTFPGFQSLDYVPLFPWFGLILIGIFAAKQINWQSLKVSESQSNGLNALATIGRNSLFIYLAHQPILLGVLKLYTTLA